MRILAPKILNIELTTYCPYHCLQCYKTQQKDIDKEIDIDVLSGIMAQAEDIGVKKILLSGGEPSCYSNLQGAIINAKKRGMAVYISTGGITDLKLIERFKDLELDGLYISLNGSNENINSTSREGYIREIATLDHAMIIGIPLMINWVAREDNYSDFQNVIKLAEKYGVKQIDILKNKPDNQGIVNEQIRGESLLRLARSIKEYRGHVYIMVEACFYELRNLTGLTMNNSLLKGCSAGKYSLAINSSGKVSPCSHAPIEYWEELNKYNSLTDYWEQSEIVARYRTSTCKQSACIECYYGDKCEMCKSFPQVACILEKK